MGALLLAAIIGLQAATWGRISPGVLALGVPVGGLTQSEAATRLGPAVQELLDRPITLRVDDRTWDSNLRSLGLQVDPSTLAAAAFEADRQGNPLNRLSEQMTSLLVGRNIGLSTGTDLSALDASLTTIAAQVDRQRQNAHLGLASDGTVDLTAAEPGVSLDVPASRERIAGALSSGASSIDLVVQESQPEIGNEQVQSARDQLQSILGASDGPVLTLTSEAQSWPLSRADVVKALAVQDATTSTAATVTIDDSAVGAIAQQIAAAVDEDVQDARFAWNGGQMTPIRESHDGLQVDVPATTQLIEQQLLSGGRTAEIPTTVVKPAVSTGDAQSLGITELIDSGSTSFSGGVSEKAWNIQLAAQNLNGVVVPPGGTFSFNKEVGPTTLDAGYKWGFGIESGADGPKTVPSVAGGICQVATTLFQPVFWAGYPLEERYWHLYWIPAYTSRGVVGLDTTVDSDSNLDFQWTNPTQDAILIQASADSSSVYFSLYGKKPDWTVHVDDPTITNRVPADPRPLADTDPTLPWGESIPVEVARDGFDVTVNRTVTPRDGSDPRVLNLHSSYEPARTTTLIGTKGMPSSVNLADVISRIVGPSSAVGTTPAENKPAPASAPVQDVKPASQSSTAAGSGSQSSGTTAGTSAGSSAATTAPTSSAASHTTTGTTGASGTAGTTGSTGASGSAGSSSAAATPAGLQAASQSTTAKPTAVPAPTTPPVTKPPTAPAVVPTPALRH